VTFGTAPFGTSRFGGAGEIVIRGAVAVSVREVLVDFDKRPSALLPDAFDSATNPKNWAIAAVDPTIGTATPPTPVPTYQPTVIGVSYDDFNAPTQVLVGVDLDMEPFVLYDLTAQPALKGAECEELVDQVTWRVTSRRRATPAMQPSAYYLDRYRDFHTDGDGFVLDPNQDIALHGGLDGLRKRVLRRVTTGLGAFVMLDGYGTMPKIKSTIRRGDLQSLANAIFEQLVQEPDVLQASAVVRLAGAPQVVQVEVSVARREGLDQFFFFDFPVGAA